MIYFKNEVGEVYAYENMQDRIDWGTDDLVEMTPEEVDNFLNPEKPKKSPQKVTRAQGKAALILAGLYEDVQAYIDSLEGVEMEIAYIAFNETNTWDRDSEFLKNSAEALNLSEEQLDDLFIAAGNIQF